MSDGAGRRFLAALLIVLAGAALLRGAWLTADPPTRPPQGIIWHDEGAWVHNARNRALWGAWRTDEWNPIFITPVFTGLEYAVFRTLGVGTWQARTVPLGSGLFAIACLAWGLSGVAGRRAALIGGCLLATNYVFVMWNRAALMESTMTAFIVAAWAAYARAERRPALGLLAGAAVALAWFTKASAAFFVLALVADSLATLMLAWSSGLRDRFGVQAPSGLVRRAAAWTLAGLALAGGLAFAAFVLPHWSEYSFYNWQMSVMRKPEYTIRAFADRASWLPIVHDYFTRMWLVSAAGSLALVAIAANWRRARPAERLLVLWVLLGFAELVVHDSGNERRYVMFIPALIALTSVLLGRPELLLPGRAELEGRARWVAIPLVLFLAYLVLGSLVRLAFLQQIGPAVRTSAALAVVVGALVAWRWGVIGDWLSRQQIATPAAILLTAITVGGDLAQYWQWARQRTHLNYEASVQVGRALPPGTLVHGKLANGLSLENRIRPIFVGRGFGNYADRKTRDDVRYILTYVAPSLGYESQARNPVIKDVLDAYPNRRVIMTFNVAETTTGYDRAALIDKFGSGERRDLSHVSGRAQN